MDDVQARHYAWASRNFPTDDPSRQILRCALGAAEEVGELCHAVLKADTNIRGDSDAHDLEAMDAIGDAALFLMHLCSIKGWSFERIVLATAKVVHERDWLDNPDDGT